MYVFANVFYVPGMIIRVLSKCGLW